MNKENIKVGDRVEIINDSGWEGIRGVVLEVAGTVALKPDDGSVYKHTGKPIYKEYREKTAGWPFNKLKLIERAKVEYPEWAKERAIEILNQKSKDNGWAGGGVDLSDFPHFSYMHVIADYVMATEEAPTDPLLLKARDCAAQAWEAKWKDGYGDKQALDCRNGTNDDHVPVQAALLALRLASKES